MAMFNENLCNFLTECRNNALDELKTNNQYVEQKKKQSKLFLQLKLIINPETKEIFEEYLEVTSALQSMELNKALLCGLTIQSDIGLHLNTSTLEYQNFLKEYIL